MLKTVLSVVLFSFLIFPQENDSLLFQNDKSLADSIIISVTDTTVSVDTAEVTQVVSKDTLVPIQGEPLTDVSSIISRRTFLFENYQYTGDLLRSFNLNFIKHLGFVGYPHETFIYGVGNNGVSYLQDGLLINNRFTNSLDLNFVQSEDIDSIEIVPSPRGFLYGPYNNPVTVNFITRDFVTPVPYSRIKYYEGPDGEAMIDGQFNAMLANRWNFSFQATNRIVDETYTNTEFSIWQVNTKLKYFLSNSVNISGSYYFVGSNQGLNGGVDYDSLIQISDNPASDLYEPFAAPVLYPNQTLDVTQHNLRLRTLVKPFDDSQLDLSIYYRYNLDELRDFRDSLNIEEDEKNKRFGAFLNFYYGFDYITFQLLGDYQKINTNFQNNYNNYGNSNSEEEHYSVAGLISLHTMDKSLKLSFFYKTFHWEIPNLGDFSGVGIDLKYELNNLLSLYAGYSIREEYLNRETPSFETGIHYSNSKLILNLKYSSNEYFNYWDRLGGPELLTLQPNEKVKCIGLNLNYKLWKLLLETNASYYFEVKNQSSVEIYSDQPTNIPEAQFIAGIFVNDFFFDNNLELKTGFKFYYIGKINSSDRWWWRHTVVDPTNKLDFTLAGEIQKVAIFYFQWENLFGNQYYITPYYPMPERSIRFGLAWELFN